jgi:hypothetical protein
VCSVIFYLIMLLVIPMGYPACEPRDYILFGSLEVLAVWSIRVTTVLVFSWGGGLYVYDTFWLLRRLIEVHDTAMALVVALELAGELILYACSLLIAIGQTRRAQCTWLAFWVLSLFLMPQIRDWRARRPPRREAPPVVQM